MIFDAADPLDLKLGHALQLDGRAPFSRIASVLGVSDHTVARRYTRLRSRGWLRVRGLPDPVRLGQTQWFVRIGCVPGVSVGLAEALARRPDTAWITLNSGGTQVTCVLRTEPGQDEDLLLRLLPSSARVTSVSAHCALHSFFGNHKSLLNKTGVLAQQQIDELAQPEPRSTVDTVELEPGDRRLLAVLAEDGRAGFAELASATGWSLTTVRRRLSDLQDSGVLYFDVDYELAILGPHVRMTLWLSVAPDKLTEAGEALGRHPETAYVAATTGVSNLYASIVSPSNEALYRYLTTDVAALPGIQHLETAPVIRTVKTTGRRMPAEAPA
ncbi:MAG TPA: AsnC family transcriptional regulator [Pseudonocardiaceae bacterium]|nr:AsnC family transcriptional regulator [Pseudonocardiaceae bacterium]